jgi:MYXO-CTERM domain-containing protein
VERPLETVYGLGRLAFGAGLLAAPGPLGQVLFGKPARKTAVRAMFRFYGTRDTALGIGTLRAVSRGEDVRGWLVAGIASDLLDAGVMLGERHAMPPEKLKPGVVSALGAAALGAALLVRRSTPEGDW